MISLDSNTQEQFKHKNKSLPASPDKDNLLMDNTKTLKDSLVHSGASKNENKTPKSTTTSQTNSLYGSIDGVNVRFSDPEGSNGDDSAEFDGLIYKDTNNSTNTLYMLNVLRKNRHLCDIILQLDDDSQDIYCHQLILACNSKFFMEIFNNYEAENSQTRSNQDNSEKDNLEETPKTPVTTKNSLTDFVNKNHCANNRQILFCLSSHLRHFLSDSHHHYAKINSIINHNNHQYQKNHCHSSNHNIDTKKSDETMDQINQNLDHQALKICIDYMYTSKLKVPSHLLPHVYTLAYHLSIENIVQVCAQYLTRLLNADNCLSIRSFALDENLIEASTECIEMNIEYILQLKPTSLSNILTSRGSVSSSMSSLISNSYTKINGVNTNNSPVADNFDLTKSCSTLSSSLNIANKEFNQLPRIQIELVGLKNHKFKLPEGIDTLTELCMNWLVDELVENKGEKDQKHDLVDLCEHLNMLYLNSDSTLHDCCDMDSSDINFDDYIDDYKKRHNVLNSMLTPDSNNLKNIKKNKRKNKNKQGNSTKIKPSPGPNNRMKTFTITDEELNNIGTATPVKLKVLHDNEVICTHQTSENSFMTICTLNEKLVTLSVHLLTKKKWTGSTENEIFQNVIFQNAEQLMVNENAINQIETRGRITSNKSDTLSELSFNVDPLQASLDQQHINNNGSNNGSKIQFDRSLSSNSTLDSEKIPRMSIARCSHGVISYENQLHIIGGYDRGECLNSCEVYDPATNCLTPMKSNLNNRRGRAAITYFNKGNSIYVMGGSDGHQDLNSIESFDMTKKEWICKTFDFELACSNLATATCRDFIYLVGLKSEKSKKSLKMHTSCLKYEPFTNQFTRMSELNQGRSQGALICTSVNLSLNSENAEKIDMLFVFGGHDQIRCLNSCEVYNMIDDKWSAIPSMHEAKRGCGAVAHDETNSVYIVGGTNGTQSLKSLEIYNVLTQTWTHGPELNIARANVAIAFIGNNLFAVGGFDGKSFLRTIEYLNINNMESGWSLYHKQHDFIP